MSGLWQQVQKKNDTWLICKGDFWSKLIQNQNQSLCELASQRTIFFSENNKKNIKYFKFINLKEMNSFKLNKNIVKHIWFGQIILITNA